METAGCGQVFAASCNAGAAEGERRFACFWNKKIDQNRKGYNPRRAGEVGERRMGVYPYFSVLKIAQETATSARVLCKT